MTGDEADFIGAMNMCGEISDEAYKKIMCHCEEQEPCEDAISRAEVKKIAKEMYLEVANMELDVNTISDCISYTSSKCREVLERKMQALPSVTPKQKTGKWKLVQRGKCVDLCCANCGAVRIEEIAYNYTIDELNKFFKEDFKEYLKHPDMSYCPCCGTKMENEDI